MCPTSNGRVGQVGVAARGRARFQCCNWLDQASLFWLLRRCAEYGTFTTVDPEKADFSFILTLVKIQERHCDRDHCAYDKKG